MAELSTITPTELREFAATVIRPEPDPLTPCRVTRRKVVVAVRGSAEVAVADAASSASPNEGVAGNPPAAEASAVLSAIARVATLEICQLLCQLRSCILRCSTAEGGSSAAFSRGGVEKPLPVDKIAHFKMGCEIWPNVAALYQQKAVVAQQQQ